MLKKTALVSFDPKQFKAKITEQTREIMREIMEKERRHGRQKPPIPPSRPFDLNAKNFGRREIEEDQETLLVEPVIRPRVDMSEGVEKPYWAKDLAKSMA